MPDDTINPAAVKPKILGSETVNGGRDRADRIVELSPDGKEIVEHLRVVTQTYVDRLHADGHLSRDVREAADMAYAASLLRQDWLDAGTRVGRVGSSDPGSPGGGGRRFADWIVEDEEAYGRYTAALGSLTPMDANIARRAVISEQWVRLEPLRSALAGLVRHYVAMRRAR